MLASDSDGTGASLGYSGSSVAVSGDTVVVGVPSQNNYTGAAYVFEQPAPPAPPAPQ